MTIAGKTIAGRLLAGVSGLCLTILTTLSPANAAPQILAAIELASGAPLICDGDGCHTDFATFCLQQDRPVPGTGTAYVPAKTAQFHLRLKTPEGGVREVPLPTGTTFTTLRGFTSVRAAFGPSTIAGTGLTRAELKRARLVVTSGASLIPAAVPGDPKPLSADEIAYATQSLRPLGSKTVDRAPETRSAQILGSIGLRITRPSAEPSRPHLERLWRDVIDDLAPELSPLPENGSAAKSKARDLARDLFDACTQPGLYGSLAGVRNCLSYRQDEILQKLNGDYWKQTPGS